MKILVDTCTFLWLAQDAPDLSPAAKAACVDPANEVFLSAVSAWEIAIKYRLGRLPLPEPPAVYVPSRRSFLRLDAQDFDERSAAHTATLPDLHRDPFDRALVAQAIVHGMTIATPDPRVRAYPAPTLW
jgi:PIN domain nuclease of toxin-antitoxin system